jgi:hypothetical protein
VALAAVTAWVVAAAVCPEMPEAFAAATQPNIHGDRADSKSGHADGHMSCHRAAHLEAVLQFSKAIRAGGTIAASAQLGVAFTRSDLTASAGPVVEIARAIDDRLRRRSARFASFWPHAPPLTL